MNSAPGTIMPDLCNRRYPFHYVTAVMLLKKIGVDIATIHMLAIGPYENYKGEVLHQEPSPGTVLTEHTEISLRVGMSSAVDYMPYQFFYGLGGSTTRSSGWEDDARGLMAPFDGAVIRWEAEATYEMLKYALSTIDYDHLVRLLGLFRFDVNRDATDHTQVALWAALLPTFHLWAGNAEQVCSVLGVMFGQRFVINENTPTTHVIPEDLRSELGQAKGRLGTELVLGRKFEELESGYEVIVCDIDASEAADWLPGKPNRTRLDQVLCLCMPSNLDYEIRIRVKPTETPLGTTNSCAWLGMATYLSGNRKPVHIQGT